jgi:alpha-tubulin suppressor-like RCC1 family protein
MTPSRLFHWFARALLLGVCCGVSPMAHGQGQVVGWGSNLNGELRLVTESLLPFASVHGGVYHSVGLRADGTVACWGSNVLGQCTSPADLGPVKLVDAGSFHCAAVRIDGTVVCWGHNASGQCNVPAGIVDVRSISAGHAHTLALQASGVVRAWGLNSSGQCNVPAQPSLGQVAQVSAGSSHSMALRSDGTVLCWGSNAVNQSNVPPALGGVVHVSAGDQFSAALKSDGSIALWGSMTSAPSGFPASSSIDAGASHVMALGRDGIVRCFGANNSGQSTLPSGFDGRAVALGAGGGHSLVVKPDGQVLGWGLNNALQCDAPEAMRRAERVSAGNSFSVVVNALDRVRAWGQNGQGQCLPPSEMGTVLEAEAGYWHVVSLNSVGTVTCWGSNIDNYNVVHNQSMTPTGLGACSTVSAGWFHSMAVKADGTVVCWGAGQTDTGIDRNHGQSIVPVPLTNVVAVSGGGLHTMALKQNGVVRCWGAGTTVGNPPHYGQSIVPPDLGAVQAVAAGGDHSVALLVDGSVRCWGANYAGQSSVPAGLIGVERIAAGGQHTAVLLADGSVRCWGSNASGQCSVPAGMGPVAQIACGVGHTLARLKTVASGCNNTAGDGTASVAISGSSWQDVPAWAWSDGGGPQTPGSLTDVDLGRYGSIGSACDAQCGTFLARSGSTLIVPVDLTIPAAAQEDHAVSVVGSATMAGRILLLASGAQELPLDLDLKVLRSPQPLGTFDIIRSTVPAPDGWFLTLVPTSEPDGSTLYSLRLLKLQAKPRSTPAQGAFIGGQVIAAEAIDYDGDGFDDLAVAIDFGPSLPGRLQVLLNDGQGNLGQTSVQANTLPSPTCLAVDDLSRDGKPDVVVGSSAQPIVQTFLNAYPPPQGGAPPFGQGPNLPVVGGIPASVVILPRIVGVLGTEEAEVVVGTDTGDGDAGKVDVYADSTGDGVPDTQSGTVAVPTTPTTTTTRGRRVATGGASSTTLGGTAAAGRIVVLTRGGSQNGFQINQQIDVPGAPVSMLFRDINRDGAAELVSANAQPQQQGSGSALPVLTIFRGTDTTPGQPGGEVYGDPIPVAPLGASEGLDVDLVDADGDGDRDVVCVVGTSSVDSSASLIRIDTQPGLPGGPITIGDETVLSAQDPVLCVRADLDGLGGEDVVLVEADAAGASFAIGSTARPVRLEADESCSADLDGNGSVDGADLGIVLVRWGLSGQGDVNNDGTIDGADLGALLVAWGPCGG